MSIVIKEVLTKKELKKFVEFPNIMYKENAYYTPFLFNDEMDLFTKEKNPAYDFSETKLFLAYIDNKVVGRICGLINHAYNEKWDKRAIRFNHFDFIDNYEVSEALFNEVVKWGKEKGLVEIMGPIGFSDMDHEGMLIEGFEELNMSLTYYNYPYYKDHMERLGLRKDVDWVEYQVMVPKERDERIARISEHLQKRYGYKVVFYKKQKPLLEDAKAAFEVVDKEFAKLYGTVPLTEKMVNKTIKDYLPLVNLKYLCTVKDKNDKVIAFALLLPSFVKAIKKSNGRLLPLGIFRILKALKGKNDVLEMYWIAVAGEHQNKGVPAIIMDEMLKMFIDNNIKYCETGPELEKNEAVQSMWKSFEKRQHRRRRCFIKEI